MVNYRHMERRNIMAKILIVDDSKTSRKFLRNMLEQAGHEIVAEAVNGA